MKKKFIFIGLFLLTCMITVHAYTEYQAIQVENPIYIDQEKILFDHPVVNINGSTYVPVREIFEGIGYSVQWKEFDNSINIDKMDQKSHQNKFSSNIYESEQGVLENGQKYSYTSPDDFYDPSYEMEYHKYFEDLHMKGTKEYEYGAVTDAKMAVELARIYWNADADKRISYSVSYDFKNNAWVIIEIFSETLSRGPRGIVISKDNGSVLGMYGHGIQ